MPAETFRKFFRLAKVDVAQRIVYGIVTAERLDKDGEICDYASTVPQYKAVNDEIGKASDGANIMPLREMHQLKAVGAGKSIEFDDAAKEIRMAFKVVEESTWQKVLEKVLLGFSQGGKYLKRWTDGGKNYYTAIPGEVSLVDNPCLPGAIIEYVKADGSVEQYTTPSLANLSDSDVERIAEALAKSLDKSVKYLVPGGQHLPYTDESGKPSHRLMGAAWAALHGGYRGNKYEGPDKAKAIAHLTSLYHSEGLTPPSEKAAVLLAELAKYAGDSELDTELANFSARLTELVGKQSADGSDTMKPEDIKKCAAALGISVEEFEKQYVLVEGKLVKAHSMAALHGHIEKAHGHHEEMMAHHEKMGKMHAAHAAMLGKCMKACKGLMGSEEEAEKALKTLKDELKVAPAAGDQAAAGMKSEDVTKAITDALAAQQKTFDEKLEEMGKRLAPDNGGTGGARLALVGRDGKIIEKAVTSGGAINPMAVND